LIDYKKIKDEINTRILEYEKKGIKSLTPLNDSPRNSTIKLEKKKILPLKINN
jgi:hypothetical protein